MKLKLRSFIFLETDLFYQGVRPAISVGISVSRVGSSAQIKAMKQVASKIKTELAQFRELAAFAQFGSDLDAQTTARLERGKRITELFKQGQHVPMPVEIQVVLLWSVQNGIMDDIAVDSIRKFAADFTEHLTMQKAPLLKKIGDQKKLDDALVAEIKTVATSFRGTWKA